MLPNPLVLALNKILKHNQGSLTLLKKYQTKSFLLNILGLPVAAKIDTDGFLIETHHTDYDVTITIPSSITTYLADQDKLAAIKKVTFTGDNKLGLELLEILSNLQLSGLYTSDSPMVNLVLGQIVNLITTIKNYLQLLAKNAATSISEYLVYETGDIVDRYTLEKFYTEVDQLKSRADLLSKRIAQLVKL